MGGDRIDDKINKLKGGGRGGGVRGGGQIDGKIKIK